MSSSSGVMHSGPAAGGGGGPFRQQPEPPPLAPGPVPHVAAALAMGSKMPGHAATLTANGPAPATGPAPTAKKVSPHVLVKAVNSGNVAMVISGSDKEEEVNVDEVEPSQVVVLTRPSGDSKRHPALLNIKKNSRDRSSAHHPVVLDGGKNDSYCWVCHEGGEVLCCDTCPRVFHFKCTKLEEEPEGDEWFCPVCLALAKKIKKTRPADLKECLLLGVHRMMLPGTDLFQTDVSDDLKEEYRQLVFHPLHLGMIKEKVVRGGYSNTRDFLADTEWIHHNCIIFNGARHELTKIAKNIIRQCQNDMKEIELAPCCFKNMTIKKDWFEIPCSPPHKVVLAKVNRYPIWPAKLINTGQDRYDVRFFGQHDRAIVPRTSVQEFRGTLTTPPSLTTAKQKEWTSTVAELKRYLLNVHAATATSGSSGSAPGPALPEKVVVEPPALLPPLSLPTAAAPPTTSAATPTTAASKLELGVTIQGGPFPTVNHLLTPPPPIANGVAVAKETDAMDTSEPIPLTTGGGRSRGDSDSEPEMLGSRDRDRSDRDFVPRPTPPPRGKAGKLTAAVPRASTAAAAPVKVDGGIPRGIPLLTKPSPTLPVKRKAPNSQSPSATNSKKAAVEKRKENAASSAANNSSSASRPGSEPGRKFARPPVSSSSLASRAAVLSMVRDEIEPAPPPRPRPPVTVATTTGAPVLTTPPAAVPGGGGAPSQQQPQALPHPQLLSSLVKSVFGLDSHPAAPPPEGPAPSRPPPHSPPPPERLPGDGVLAKTVNAVRGAQHSELRAVAGAGRDMGYHHYSERLMSSVQLVLLDMLADFHSRGSAVAKPTGEQLLTSWPLGPAHSSVQGLRAELRVELDLRVEQVRAAAKLEYEARLEALRQSQDEERGRRVEAAVASAVADTKKKHWCSFCAKEAAHYCCWHAAYCSEDCQNSHWLEHQKQCLNPQITGVSGSSAGTSDTSGGGGGRLGIALTPNLMSPTHDGRPGNSSAGGGVFSFSAASTPTPHHTPHISLPAPVMQTSASEEPLVGHSSLVPNVVVATGIPSASMSNQINPLRTVAVPASSVSVPNSIPISPNLPGAKSSPSLHSNPSSVSTSGSSLTTQSTDTGVSHLHHALSESLGNTRPLLQQSTAGHHGDHRHGLSAVGEVSAQQPSPAAPTAQLPATAQTPLYWQYPSQSTRYPPQFTHPIMMYPNPEHVLYQQQLLAEQQSSAGGGGAHP